MKAITCVTRFVHSFTTSGRNKSFITCFVCPFLLPVHGLFLNFNCNPSRWCLMWQMEAASLVLGLGM